MPASHSSKISVFRIEIELPTLLRFNFPLLQGQLHPKIQHNPPSLYILITDSTSDTLIHFHPYQRKEERLLNFVRPSVMFVILIFAVIAVAFVLSILPQEVRWILFILSIAFPVILIIRNSNK